MATGTSGAIVVEVDEGGNVGDVVLVDVVEVDVEVGAIVVDVDVVVEVDGIVVDRDVVVVVDGIVVVLDVVDVDEVVVVVDDVVVEEVDVEVGATVVDVVVEEVVVVDVVVVVVVVVVVAFVVVVVVDEVVVGVVVDVVVDRTVVGWREVGGAFDSVERLNSVEDSDATSSPADSVGTFESEDATVSIGLVSNTRAAGSSSPPRTLAPKTNQHTPPVSRTPASAYAIDNRRSR